ncbi:CRISPR-associated endonuclease Cas1, subtype II/NMENI [Malacoplasma iowae]|nr:CRISPR-associated endonuclease Cas1, subtype II/NMENI [Mycoplasmopsis fermentans]VEU71779.1 CRISPR-associated endonuclease Cas1, subtype II/NMENI [Malacoplasma iowae]
MNWNHKFKSNLWTNIIKQKIYNQFYFVKNILKNELRSNIILEFMNQVQEYDITNREGHASKVYWNTLFGLDFTRDQNNYINSLLNYGYTILNGYISRSIIKKGLDPRISLFHKSYHNHFALSSDLIEPFRIIVDIEVYKIWKTNENNLMKHKENILNLFNKKIMINNKLQYVNNAIDIFIDSVVNQGNFPIFDFFYEL